MLEKIKILIAFGRDINALVSDIIESRGENSEAGADLSPAETAKINADLNRLIERTKSLLTP